MVSADRWRRMFMSIYGAVLGVAIVVTADFALAQLTHVGSLPTAAKEFAQRSALLAQAGDRESAVEASRNAVDAYRRLVHGSPVHYEPGLAASLHDLSFRLSEAGDTAGARAAIEEAIVMRRRWARYGARHAEGLAKSLALLTSIEMAVSGSERPRTPCAKAAHVRDTQTIHQLAPCGRCERESRPQSQIAPAPSISA